MSLEVSVTWGEAEDICISNKGSIYILMEDPIKSGFIHGVSEDGQLPLSMEEAETLVRDLLTAIDRVKYLKNSYEY